MLKKYDMDNFKLVPTPIAHGELLYKGDGADIVHVDSHMFRYMNEPFALHLKVAKRILRYVKGTVDFGIHYFTSKDVDLVGFNDLDWGNNLDDWKSTFGNCFSLGFGWLLGDWTHWSYNNCCSNLRAQESVGGDSWETNWSHCNFLWQHECHSVGKESCPT